MSPRGLRATLACALLLAGCALAAEPRVGAKAYDSRAYATANSEIMKAIGAEDFARLDELYAEYGAAAARAQDGTWMGKAFLLSFGPVFSAGPVGRVEDFFSDWKARDPASKLRPVAEALAWQERAWAAKGGSCYEQSSSASRKAFNTLLDRSAAALREVEARSGDSSLWHVAALLVAGGQLRPASELDGLLREYTAKFPAFEPLYVARMTFLLPAWGGDFEGIDRFIRAAAAQTQSIEGRALYAWLYVDLASVPGCGQLFDRSLVSWPDMKAAFDDMLERHPDVRNRNIYATFACRARDASTTARLMGELGSDAHLGFWSPGISNDSCRSMIRDASPLSGPERAS